MNLLLQLGIGLLFSGAIGFLAYRRGSLTVSGALGALIVGTLIFGFGGWVWGLLLIAFFVSSSLLSHYREGEKERVAAEKFDKGSQRDLGQALANAGAGSLVAVAAFLLPGAAWAGAFLGAMATVTADTWATELGVLNPSPPRLITTLQPVEPGTSGGVSRAGTLAALSGGLFIGLLGAIFAAISRLIQPATPGLPWLPALAAAGIGGLAGSLIDSLLGATVQVLYYSAGRDKLTEKRIDPDGTPNTYARGWRWLNNDAVNFISSLGGAAIGAGLWVLLA